MRAGTEGGDSPVRNRSIPFGYHYQNGVLAVHPQESQTVRAVFAAYLSREPLSKIAAHLTTKLAEYLPGRWQWDKARVKRILDNSKYMGEGDFPQIILTIEKRTSPAGLAPVDIAPI